MEHTVSTQSTLQRLFELLDYAKERNASDIYMVAGDPPAVRVSGRVEIFSDSEPVSTQEVRALIRWALPPEEADKIERKIEKLGDADFSFARGSQAYRCNAYRHRKGLGVAIRPIPRRAWTINEIGLPHYVLDFCMKKQGLIIVAGPTGSGKSTTLACMIEFINRHTKGHIITIEDPIEYRFEPVQCVISQRQVGTDAVSFAQALKAALRQAPDVIMVGEMRDLETMEMALNAAETGHIVLTTLHTYSGVQTVERIVSVFPAGKQDQIRYVLASTLLLVICQRLIPSTDGGRVLAYEIMINTPQVASLIRSNKLNQIQHQIQMGRSEGMVPLNAVLQQLYNEGRITKEVARATSYDPDELRL